MNKKNVEYTVRHDLCTGCGICADACPTHSIKMRVVKGEWRPQIDQTTCLNAKGCSKCYAVCGGVGMNIGECAENLFADATCSDSYIGRYERLYTGWSCDTSLRRQANSGGLVSSILIWLLQKGYIDGAVITKYSSGNPLEPKAFVATTTEEILEAKGSKYAPVQLSETLRNIIASQGGEKKIAVVGLPCHIQSIRKWAKSDKGLDKILVAYFALYCSSERTFYAQDYLLRRFRVDKQDVRYFSFRECGRLKMVGADGSDLLESKGLKTPPFYYYYGLIGSHFKPNRCQMCVDHYGMLADMSFGDIGIAPYTSDKIGINSLVIRSKKFASLMDEAVRDGAIELAPLDPDLLNKSQRDMMFSRLKKAKAKCLLNRLAWRQSPEYDVLDGVSTTIHDILKIIVVDIKRFIGKRKYLWALIDLENRKKKI